MSHPIGDAPTVALINLMPENFQAQIEEIQSAPYITRTYIYKASDTLRIGQTQGAGDAIDIIPAGANLTVQAMTVEIWGDIAIPQADIQIYCRTLSIPANQ